MELFGEALGLGAIGLVAGLLGAVVAALATRGQTSTLTSYVQHFAAGLIIAAATLDLLPEAFDAGGGWPVILGFAAGTAFMLGLRALIVRLGHGPAGDDQGHEGHAPDGRGHDEHTRDGQGLGAGADAHGRVGARTPVATGVNLGLVIALAVVVLIDGAVIGIAVSAGGGAATLIAIALSIELLFVAASTAGSTRARGGTVKAAIGAGGAVAAMMPIGAVLGAVAFAGVSAPVLIAGLAFGAAALLFTAVAELLVEAYEIKESTGTIAMAATGFLLFLVLMMLM